MSIDIQIPFLQLIPPLLLTSRCRLTLFVANKPSTRLPWRHYHNLTLIDLSPVKPNILFNGLWRRISKPAIDITGICAQSTHRRNGNGEISSMTSESSTITLIILHGEFGRQRERSTIVFLKNNKEPCLITRINALKSPQILEKSVGER